MDFYNSEGEATVYLYDNRYFFSFSGKPLGYLHNDKIYAFTGQHLGWYERYWIRDLYGRCIYFAENCPSEIGPHKPFKNLKQMKSFRHLMPLCLFRQFPYLKPYSLNVWSSTSEKEFWHCDFK